MLQVIAGLGIVGAIGFYTMDAIRQGSSAGKNEEYRFDVQNMVAEIGTVLKNRQACTNTLSLRDATSSTGITQIKNADDRVIYDLSTIHGSTRAQMQSMSLKDIPGSGDEVQVIPGNLGSTNLVILFKPKSGTIYETRELFGKIRISILADATGKITSCFAMGSGEDSIWKKGNPDPSEIFFSEGNVGIGTATPTDKLDVSGWVQGQNSVGGKLAFGGSATQYLVRAGEPAPVSVWDTITANLGELKVHEARAQGYVKLTSAVIPCTAARIGSIKYNRGIRRVELCTSGGWKPIAAMKWCLPPWRIAPADDADDVWIKFRQDEGAMLPQGSPCKSAFVSRTKGPHTRVDGTGWEAKFDDDSKTRKCDHDWGCRDYLTNEQ
jgi:hypothetical protein